jgi:hypothetical protein
VPNGGHGPISTVAAKDTSLASVLDLANLYCSRDFGLNSLILL